MAHPNCRLEIILLIGQNVYIHFTFRQVKKETQSGLIKCQLDIREKIFLVTMARKYGVNSSCGAFPHLRKLCHIATGLRNDVIIWDQCVSSVPLTWDPTITWPIEFVFSGVSCSATVTRNCTFWNECDKSET